MLDDLYRLDSTTHVIDSDQFCTPRICQDPNELQGGMGDIFVKLSLNNEIKELEQCYNE